MKKKLNFFIMFIVLLFITQITSCNNNDIINDSNIDTESIITKYSYEDIYGHEFNDEIADPSCKRINVYPTKSCVYSFFTSWNRSYINDNHEITTYSICQDSLCDHSSLPCISYASLISSDLIESNGKLYLLIQGEGDNKEQFIEYDPEIGKYVVIEEFKNGGRLLTRLGRFIYFFIIRVDGETESGKLLTTRIIYRYDVSESKLENINEFSPDNDLRLITGYNGYIYYLDTYGNLNCCDESLQNNKIIAENKIKIFSLTQEYIYYLSKENNDEYGTLYSLNLSNNKKEKLYDNLTWFCIENNMMYYSQYDPIETFEWDFPNYDTGVKKIEQKMITVMNGNKIYSIDLENAGKKQGTLLPISNLLTEKECYFGEVYAVYDGFILTQMKEAYSENNKKGMITGTTAISIETGEIYRIETEYVIYS